MNTAIEKRRLPLTALKPAKYNPRKSLKPGDAEYEKIKRSLYAFGYVDPIVWNEVTGNIVGGHQRYNIFKNEGETEADCIVVHIEDTNDEKALNVALNKAVGTWDNRGLADIFSGMAKDGYDASVTGFDKSEIEALLTKSEHGDTKDDQFDPNPDKVRRIVRLNDVWMLGTHRLMCGDSTSADDMAALMGEDKANLIVTDPPYNVSYESADGKKIANDSMGDLQFFEFLHSAFTAMAEYTVAGGSVYVFHADAGGLNFRKALIKAGFSIGGCCIWVKDSLALGRGPYQWMHEPVLYGWLPGAEHRWFADENQSTVWRFPKPKRSAEHPTMKPVPLLCYPIQNSSEPNGIVLDPFGGSGSTLIACEQTGRVCRTMELDTKYASVIVERFHTDYPDAEITVLRDGTTYTYDDVVG